MKASDTHFSNFLLVSVIAPNKTYIVKLLATDFFSQILAHSVFKM